MSTFVNAFDALWDAHTTAKASIRVGTHVYTKALCTGIDLTREVTEQGLYNEANISVRLKATDENQRYALTIDKVVEINHLASGEWVKLRIAGRKDTAGLIVLDMEALYE